jgi:hypothetical protein
MAVQQTFDGDVVFITGAASGIGAQAARKLAAAGALALLLQISTLTGRKPWRKSFAGLVTAPKP